MLNLFCSFSDRGLVNISFLWCWQDPARWGFHYENSCAPSDAHAPRWGFPVPNWDLLWMLDGRHWNTSRPTSVILNESVSVGSFLSSHTSTSDSFYPSSFRDRPGCGMHCWFNLWPRAAVSLTSVLTLLLLLRKCSSSVLLHACQLSEDRPRWQAAHPGWGLVPLHHLLRLRRDHLGLEERRRAFLPNGSWERRPELQNRAEQPHNQCSDIVARELEVHGGVSVQRSSH